MKLFWVLCVRVFVCGRSLGTQKFLCHLQPMPQLRQCQCFNPFTKPEIKPELSRCPKPLQSDP